MDNWLEEPCLPTCGGQCLQSERVERVERPKDDDDTEFVVKGIIAKRGKGDSTEYKVRWQGYGEEDDEWLLRSDWSVPKLYSPSLKLRPRRSSPSSPRTRKSDTRGRALPRTPRPATTPRVCGAG